MKKILAVLMSIVMMFALVAMPVSAADEAAAETTTEVADEVTLEEFISTVELTVELIKDTLVKVHYIVGTVMGVLEKECPLCGETHAADFATSDSTKDEIVEDEVVAEDDLKAPVEFF